MISLTYNIPFSMYSGFFKAEETALLMHAGRELGIEVISRCPMEDPLLKTLPKAYFNMNGYVSKSHYRMIREMELLGVKSLNLSDNAYQADEKYFCNLKLRHNNIPTPKMIDINQLFGVLQNSKKRITNLIYDSIGFPCVIKVPNSGYGNGVVLINNENEFDDWYAMSAWMNPKFGYNETGTDFIAQEFIESSKGKALRILILNDDYLGCMYRENSNNWKINSEIDGSIASKYQPDKNLIDLCFKALKILDLRFAAVDILFTDNDYTINEVNSSPGFKTFHSLHPEVNLPNLLITSLAKIS